MPSLQSVVRRIAKGVVPKPVIAAYRRWLYDRSRNNVLIILPEGESPRRWVRSTPNTYRVMQLADGVKQSLSEDVTSKVRLLGAGEDERAIATQALAGSGLGAVFVGTLDFPAWPSRVRLEPIAHPVAAAVSPETLDDLGGGTPHDSPASLLNRARSAGVEYGLVPLSGVERNLSREGASSAPKVLILAAVPMYDIGGGSRAAQLALEMVRRGMLVDYVSVFPSYETYDLGLRFVHPGLAEFRLDEYLATHFESNLGGGRWALVEVPTKEAARIATELKSRQWSVCYDIIDRWSDPSLGGDWFEQEMEDHLVESSDVVVVSALDLSERPRRLGREPVLIPNGVDSHLFGSAVGPVPADLPGGSPVIGYHGSLYGEWLDWGLMSDVAHSYPDATVVVIGDVRAGHPAMPENVHFLGLKPQHDLPEYISRFDVGILPFKVSETTHAVSPLKVFEYLASGVPVASPPLRSLDGLAGVYTARSVVEAVAEALAAPRPDRRMALQEHGWHARVDRLLDAFEFHPRTVSGTPAERRMKPVVRYERSERLITSPD